MAKVIKFLNDLQTELETLKEKYSSYRLQMEEISLSSEVLNVSELAVCKSYMGTLEKQIFEKQKMIEQTQKVLQAKQKEVNEALKEVKVLDKLKETQSKKFYDAVYKKEAEEIDDIVTARYKVQQV